MATTVQEPARAQRSTLAHVLAGQTTIAVLAFLTVVDLFAAQALLPTLARIYAVDPAAMATAVNSSTLGMAIAALSVATLKRPIDRRRTVSASLALLAVPTVLLAFAPNVATFAALRVVQGLLMATAFALTLAHFAETTEPSRTGTAFAAYITGNVASNLFGRLIAATVADMSGIGAAFLVFAALNLAGAALAAWALRQRQSVSIAVTSSAGRSGQLRRLLGAQHLRSAFAIGFCILFAFIGTFSYVNYVLAAPPLALGMMQLGLVYLVFAPSIVTTPLAGRIAKRWGTRAALSFGLLVALTGLPLLVTSHLPLLLLGLACVGVGTFLAQAVASGYVGRSTGPDASAASGLYLACYFVGGLAGSAILGQVFRHAGWPWTVAGVAVAIGTAMILATRLRD